MAEIDVYGETNAAMKDDYEKRELQQKRHYFLYSQLQSMSRELPGNFQQRLPYDLLSSLANCLLDGTVFEIVKGLRDVQQWEERTLFNQRSKLVSDHKAQKHELQKKHKEMLQDCQARPHNLARTKLQIERELETQTSRFEEEVKKKDMKVVLELDQKVLEQQSTLEKVGLPGFYVTNKPNELRLQMYLLDFVHRLSQMELPS